MSFSLSYLMINSHPFTNMCCTELVSQGLNRSLDITMFGYNARDETATYETDPHSTSFFSFMSCQTIKQGHSLYKIVYIFWP